MLFIWKLETWEVLFITRKSLETHSFFSRVKSLNMEEIKVKLMPLMSCISAASLGGLDTQLVDLQ